MYKTVVVFAPRGYNTENYNITQHNNFYLKKCIVNLCLNPIITLTHQCSVGIEKSQAQARAVVGDGKNKKIMEKFGMWYYGTPIRDYFNEKTFILKHKLRTVFKKDRPSSIAAHRTP